MELKPVKKVKRSEKKLNQIISESKKSNILKKIVFFCDRITCMLR